jgi:hypothetical protein
MPGPTIARNYGEVSKLVEANKNSILEVNADGSIRAQTLKEKIGNLGLRITGRFTATKAEKDAKVAIAISNLYNKAGYNDGVAYFDPKNNKDYARFYKPQSIQKRVATKEVKGRPSPKFQAAVSNQPAPSLKVPAQKVFFSALADQFEKLSIDPQYRQDSQGLEGLATTYRKNGRYVDESNVDSTLSKLKEDLKGVGLQLGKGPLENFDISKGVVEWVQRSGSSKELDRYS